MKLKVTIELPIDDDFTPFSNASSSDIEDWIKYNLNIKGSISNTNPLFEYELLENGELIKYSIEY